MVFELGMFLAKVGGSVVHLSWQLLRWVASMSPAVVYPGDQGCRTDLCDKYSDTCLWEVAKWGLRFERLEEKDLKDCWQQCKRKMSMGSVLCVTGVIAVVRRLFSTRQCLGTIPGNAWRTYMGPSITDQPGSAMMWGKNLTFVLSLHKVACVLLCKFTGFEWWSFGVVGW